MDKDRHSKISKFLSYVLRHKPEKIGIKLGSDGWVDVKELIEKSKNEIVFDFNELKEVVKNCDKQRFSFSSDFCEIKANQGHSTDVEIKFKEVVPPVMLFHGTVDKFLESIKKKGLLPMNRHHVHLSGDEETAIKVGSRRGKPVILKIDSKKMFADGIKIYKSDNGVYLTDKVDKKYIIF